MRLFIAILLSEDMKDALQDTMDAMREQGVWANYTQTENLHLTLAFLGEVPGGGVPEVLAAMEDHPVPAMTLTLEGVGNFGNLLFAGLSENADLKQYVRRLRSSLEAHGIPYDKKAFRPHITIARKVETGRAFDVHVARTAMPVQGISLMRSDRINGRMRYTELAFVEAG